MPVETGLCTPAVEIDSIPFRALLISLGFDRAELQKKHPDFLFYYQLDKVRAEELIKSGQHFVLCEDAEGRPLHFRNGYLYVSVVPNPKRTARTFTGLVAVDSEGKYDDDSFESH